MSIEIKLNLNMGDFLDSIDQLISSDDSFRDDFKERFEDLFDCEECDIDIVDFSDGDVFQAWWDRDLYDDLEPEQLQAICDYWDIPYHGEGSTLRDEQYTQVLQLLKEKFSVAELELLANSK